MTDASVRVLVVDDHRIVRAGIKALIDAEPDLHVVGEASDGEEAVRLAAALAPDVVLMDLRLSPDERGMDGVEATRRLLASRPGANVVVLTSYAGRSDVVRAMAAGARGYVLKAGPPDELFRAVRAAAAGMSVISSEALGMLVSQAADPVEVLTDRETDVLRLLAEGMSNRLIASTLFLTEATVKTHLVRIYRKLGAENRAGAVSEAVRRGLVDIG